MSEEQSTVEYRIVVGFPKYRVGSDGSVWSKKATWWKRLKPKALKSYGHQYVTLMPGTAYRYIHRLVLEAFVGPCPEGLQSCHDPDPDPSNNNLSNLRWGTPKENMADKMRLNRQHKGEQIVQSKLTEEQVREIRTAVAQGERQQAVGNRYGVRQGIVSQIVNRKIWKHVS